MAQAFFKITLNNGTTPLILTDNPAGIEGFEVTYARHEVYGTVFRSIGDNLRFVKDGADYIRTIFLASGIDGECSITIATINLNNKTYSTEYEGIIDFSTYNEDEDFVEVGVIDSSILSKFLAREKTEVNLLDTVNLDGDTITNPLPSSIELELPPINPVYWAIGTGNILRAESDSVIQISGGVTVYNDSVNGNSSFNNIGSDWDGTTLVWSNPFILATDSVMQYDIEILVSGNIDVTKWIAEVPPTPDPEFTFDFRLYRLDTGAIYKQYIVTADAVGNFPINYSFNEVGEFASSIPVSGSQGFGIVCIISSNGGTANFEGSWDFDYEMVVNNLEFEYTDPVTVAQSNTVAYRPIDLGKIVLEQMGIDSVITPFQSTKFQTGGDYEFVLLTNGKSIRKFPSSTPINVSFREMFTGYGNSLGMILSYDSNGFTFESIDDFYKTSATVLTISKYSNLKILIAEARYFNKIIIGYENQSYDDINGNVEFNTNFSFSTVNKNITNELEKTSPVRADSLGIELLRRKDYKTTGAEDDDSDNDLFFVKSKYISVGSYYIAETGSDYTVTGLKAADQYYNYFLTPKSNLVRNGFFVNTSLNYQPKEVKYVRSKNNIPLVIDGLPELDGDYNETLTGGVIPIYIEFNTILDSNLLSFLENTPNGLITVSGVGSGYIETLTLNLYTREVQIKLIKYS